MIGYKATTNGKCKRKTYKVGETYTLKGEMKMCKKGFHFCQDLYDVFNYYLPSKDTKVFKVEALGNIETIADKTVTDNIKILEEVNLSNMILEKYGNKMYFDNKGNCIKTEYPDGFWWKYEYDFNNNLIKEEKSDGSWTKFEYNEKNKWIKTEYGRGQSI